MSSSLLEYDRQKSPIELDLPSFVSTHISVMVCVCVSVCVSVSVSVCKVKGEMGVKS